jgi:hypothetical protein
VQGVIGTVVRATLVMRLVALGLCSKAK